MKNKIVYVVSDSVGETADLVVRAAMGQFPFAPDIRRVPYVEDTGTLKRLFRLLKVIERLLLYVSKA